MIEAAKSNLRTEDKTAVRLKSGLDSLKDYCEQNHFTGYDPYDGLNSTLFQALPLLSRSRLIRLAWIQFFKRSPINLRPLVGVKKDYNPKALGLFLSSYCMLNKVNPSSQNNELIDFFVEKILNLVSEGYQGKCWGYNFDWQARAFFQPKYTPTVVASTFIAHGLIDAYEITNNPSLLDAARSTCDFILKDLNRTYDDDGDFAFSYSPLDTSVVFNASLLGSKLLARVYQYTQEPQLRSEAKKSVAFCCKHQKEDGSWSYGLYDFHRWIDNFHTGYNLECIAQFNKCAKDQTFEKNVEKGFEYYKNTFFTNEGVPKYYNNSVYPIDIHAPAQLVSTLVKLDKFDENKALADRVLLWTIENMQSDLGYFYFQKNRFYTSRIPFIRWAQAWMFYALSMYYFKIST